MQSASPAIAPWSSPYAFDMSSDRHPHSRYSGTHLIGDPDPTDWDFAQEIARLKISSKDDDVHARTPPQSKVAAAAVAQYAESSPLESASDASPSSSPGHSISPSHSRGSSAADMREPASSSTSRNMRAGPLKITTASEHKERPHSFNGVLSASDLRRLQQAGEDSSQQWSQLRELASPEQPTYPSLAGSGYGRNQASTVSTGLRQNARMVPTGGLGYNGASSLGAQQTYDLSFPHPDPAVARIQQQHGAFRSVHQHSTSDPSSTLRDAAALAMLSNPNGFSQPGVYPPAAPLPMGMYPQAYRPDTYSSNIAATQAMLNRIQQTQFTGPFGVMSAPSMAIEAGTSGVGLSAPAPPASSSNGSGPSANNRKLGLYKTELCRSWEEKGTCRYGTKCQFAHGEGELRPVARHPKYKTEICRTFWVSGACPYGKRCCFIHTELPANGAPPGADGAPPPSAMVDVRQRANSSASDPSETPTSLLSRISQHKNDSGSNLATPIDTTSVAASMYNTRPPTGSLRVDTASLTNIAKQNKSAYPTLASNANALMLNSREPAIHSPVPMTAGPDLGRSTAARLNIVGQNQRINRANQANPRHSFNGADIDFEYSSPTTPSATNPNSSFGMGSHIDRLSTSGTTPRSHVRSGSAGNWGGLPRSNLSVAFPQSELAVGSNRVNNNAQWI